jgi:GLPGLI family protein
MNRIIIPICLLFLNILSHAQDKIVLNVTYTFAYVRDLENKGDPYTADMVLSLGKHNSRYCSEKLFNERDATAQREKARQRQQQDPPRGPQVTVSGGPLLIVNDHGAIINEEITKDLPGQKLIVNAVLGFKNYTVETAMPKINWEIKSEKKTIGGYSCQLAVGAYGNRTYNAWFAPDLPFQNGPWKLSGLPGLILEAKDTANEVSFTFKELSRTTDPEETTRSFLNNERSIPVRLNAYNRAKAEFEVDPEAVMTALAPNAKLMVKNIDDPQSKTVKKIKRYNPIEIN